MKIWIGSILTVLAIAYLFFAAFGVSTQANAPLAGASVRLNLESDDGVCSATHIGADRFITAWHCLEHGDIEVMTDKGTKAPAEVLWSAKVYDLALLRAKGLKLRSAAVDCTLAKPGTTVTAVGNPLGLEFVRTPGVIVSGLQSGEVEVDGDKVWRERIIADVTVAPGSSGGGLFNETGRLVGVVVGNMPPFRYATVVPSSTVCQLLGR